MRFDPKKPARIEPFPDPKQVPTAVRPGQASKPAKPIKAPKPAPQAPGVYDYAYAHFPEEGRMREPTGKNPKGESKDTLDGSKPEVDQVNQEGKQTSKAGNDNTYEGIYEGDINPSVDKSKQNDMNSPDKSSENAEDDVGILMVDNDLYNASDPVVDKM